MTTIIATFLGIFSFGQSNYDVKKIFNDLRNMSFKISPDELKLKLNDDKEVFAVFMETGYNKAALSLRCMGEGSISLYFTNGGGIIGIGEHSEARAEGLKLIKMANEYIKLAKLTTNNDLPKVGFTKFYLRTKSGIYVFEDKEDNLGNKKSLFSPLFYQAQNVITEARKIDESRNKEK